MDEVLRGSDPAGQGRAAARSGAPFVFVSYSRADGDFVGRLTRDLGEHGIACWADRDGLRAGTPDWEQEVREAIRAARAVLLVASRASRQSRFVKAELAVADLYGRPVYPVWAAGEQRIDCVPLGLVSTQFVDARSTRYLAGPHELLLLLGRAQLTMSERGDEAMMPTDDAPRNPYKGLRAFQEEDAPDFFGRTHVLSELLDALRLSLSAQGPGAGVCWPSSDQAARARAASCARACGPACGQGRSPAASAGCTWTLCCSAPIRWRRWP
jgi:hypothetical protein